MAWDERGRLWIVETVDYPNDFVETDSTANDRIKICEDTDGDGKADKFTVFADSLNIPTSITFANGGVIVSMAPYFLFLQDTDGDDKADLRKTIFTGWGKQDTHAGPSNLQYGFDNKIWGVTGYSGFDGTINGERQKFPQGVYHFKPDGSDFKFLGRTSNNTWDWASRKITMCSFPPPTTPTAPGIPCRSGTCSGSWTWAAPIPCRRSTATTMCMP